MRVLSSSSFVLRSFVPSFLRSFAQHSRQPRRDREHGNSAALANEHRILQYEHTRDALASQGLECGVKTVGRPDPDRHKLDRECCSGLLSALSHDLMCLKPGIEKHAHFDRAAKHLGGKRKLLLWQGVHAGQNSGDVASWPGMACDQTKANRIGEVDGDDRHSGCCLSHRDRRLSVTGDQNVRVKPKQLLNKRRNARQIAFDVSVHDVDLAPCHISEFLHALHKARTIPTGCEQESNERATRYLAVGCEWPCSRTPQ
jgi:hypothetical protein